MRAGRYVKQPADYSAFIPSPLPPEPTIQMDAELTRLLSDADRALGRLDGVASVLPNPNLFVGMYVRREAVLSSQIEGTQSTLEDVLQFEADARGQDTIERSSAANMRKMEETQGKKWVATFHTRSDKPFVRKASSGGWRAILPENTVTYMEAHWGPLMKQIGYKLSSETEKEPATISRQRVPAHVDLGLHACLHEFPDRPGRGRGRHAVHLLHDRCVLLHPGYTT